MQIVLCPHTTTRTTTSRTTQARGSRKAPPAFAHKRENRLLVESVNQILREAGDCDLRISHQELGYVPIFMTDEITEKRFPLKCNKIGPDHFLVSAADYGFKVNIGAAADKEVQAFLKDYKGRWSPNVFLPLFMYRCGFHGFVSGRSSLKYSIVIGHVMEKVFEEKHPPTLFCMPMGRNFLIRGLNNRAKRHYQAGNS